MGFQIGVEQLGAGDLRVDLRSIQTGVTEKLLQQADFCPALQHVRRTSVAQFVRRQWFGNPRDQSCFIQNVAHRPGA